MSRPGVAPCSHAHSSHVGRISSHEDLHAVPDGEGLYSAWVCHRAECRRRAEEACFAVSRRMPIWIPREQP